jgi:AraC-like DNA-binding protein
MNPANSANPASPASQYREWAPPSALSVGLVCLWARTASADAPRETGKTGETGETMVLPDGCVDLMWQTDRGAFFAGPDTEPIPASTPPGVTLLGARFRPGAGGPALGVPLAALLNQRVDLADLRPDLAARLPAWIDPDQAGPALIEVSAQMLATGPPDPLVAAGARMLADPRARVGELAGALGVSDRQLRRRFDVAVGYGPKTLQRVLRFRRFLTRVYAAPTDVDLASLAFEAGYADQSHLTRETAALSGLTPAGLAALASAPQSA